MSRQKLLLSRFSHWTIHSQRLSGSKPHWIHRYFYQWLQWRSVSLKLIEATLLNRVDIKSHQKIDPSWARESRTIPINLPWLTFIEINGRIRKHLESGIFRWVCSFDKFLDIREWFVRTKWRIPWKIGFWISSEVLRVYWYQTNSEILGEISDGWKY